MPRKWMLHSITGHIIDYQQHTSTKAPVLMHNCNELIFIIRQKSPILSYEIPTSFTAFTFFLKPPPRAGKRVKATMQSPSILLSKVVSVSAILYCCPFLALISLRGIKMKHYGFRK
ncbi:hypothetical protein DWX88_20970 [Bacteroides xylanisolvens]|nr:hypothetical protein DWX88_20970 [Bacteroides xylanisolvens]